MKIKKKILVIGNFNYEVQSINGQTRKTRDYLFYIKETFGDSQVDYFDTTLFRKKPLRLFVSLIKKLNKYDNILLVLGINAGSVIVPLISFFKKKYKYEIFFSVVGGGIYYDKKKEKKIVKHFSKIDSIYFETKEMTNHYKKYYDNIFYAPVFTRRELTINPRLNEVNHPIKFCTYSRVSKEKGISKAINAIKEVNERMNGIYCVLDIIGEPSIDYLEEFTLLTQGTSDFIRRIPYLSGAEVLDTLSKYDIMLFPTYYAGEGFPIAIVECFKSGVPVIASNWHFNGEIIEHNKTGLIFELGSDEFLVNSILTLINNNDLIKKMKENSFRQSKNFDPKEVLKHLIERLENIKS